MFVDYAELISIKGRERLNDLLTDLIKTDHQDRALKRSLYLRYKNKELPIQSYDPVSGRIDKVNNQINVDLFSQIVNQKVGYMAGNPIVYAFGNDADYNNFYDFYDRIGGYELDLETLKFMSCCGVAARLLYINKLGKLDCMNVLPEECLFIYDRSIQDCQYALRYYYIDEIDQGQTSQLLRVEFYDDQFVTFYIQKRTQSGQLIFDLDDSEQTNPLPHGFKKIPLVAFPNNREMMGDATRALEMIDAYDRQVSNLDSEMEQLRLAYLLVNGIKADAEVLKQGAKTGIFNLIAPGSGMQWLTKTLQTQPIETHLARLKRDIITTCHSVDVNELRASGNITGIGIKMAYTALENSCSFTEQYYKRSMINFVDCYSSHFSTSPIDSSKMTLTFTHDQPVNVAEIVDMVIKLKGIISDKTLLSQIPFVDDPEEEEKELEKTKEGVNFDMIEEDDEPGAEEDTAVI